MKISELKKKYKNKWVLAQIVKEDKFHRALDVKPIVVSSDRNQVYEQLDKLKKGAHVATIYTGEIPPKGFVYTFHVGIKV